MRKAIIIILAVIGGLVLLAALIFGIFAIIGFTVGEQEGVPFEETIEEGTGQSFENKQAYIDAYAQFWADYSDALILMTAIHTTDTTVTEYDTWHGWVEQNIAQWEALIVSAEPIIAYAQAEEDVESVTKTSLSLVKPVYAQSPTNYWDGLGAQEVQVTDPKADHDMLMRVAFDAAPRGEKLAAIVQFSGFDNPKEALAYLESLREVDRAGYNNTAKMADVLSKSATVVKNTAFVTVSIGGIVLTGGQAVAATSLLAKAGYITAAGVSGGDLVLEITGDVAELTDNRKLQSATVKARENLAPAVHALNVINLAGGDKSDLPGNITTLYNYGEETYKWATAADNEETVLMYQFKPGEITLAQSDEIYQKIIAPEDPFKDVIKTVFPQPGGFKIGGNTYTTYTLPQPDIPTSGAQGTYATNEITWSQAIPDVAGSAETIGSGSFLVGEEGVVSGDFVMDQTGSFSVEGATATISGSASGTFSGEFDAQANRLTASGPYSGSATVTSNGASAGVPNDGTITIDAQLFDDVFVGTATFLPTGGIPSTIDFQAKKQ